MWYKNIIMLSYCEIYEREFENWFMGYIFYFRFVILIIFKYFGMSEFNFFVMFVGSVYKLMLVFRDLLFKS